MRCQGLLRFLWAVCFCTSLVSCGKKVPELPSVTAEQVAGPKTDSVVLERGMLLRDVADEAYGHERYYRFLAVINQIENVERIQAGKVIRTPSIAKAFQEAGLDARYQPAVYALAKASIDFQRVLPAYLAERPPSVDPGRFAISKDVSSALTEQADTIEAAVFHLRRVSPPHLVPKITLIHFDTAASWLRTLASGETDGYLYDVDFVSQHTALGLASAYVWMLEKYQ